MFFLCFFCVFLRFFGVAFGVAFGVFFLPFRAARRSWLFLELGGGSRTEGHANLKL